jgi:hypothetical protein
MTNEQREQEIREHVEGGIAYVADEEWLLDQLDAARAERDAARREITEAREEIKGLRKCLKHAHSEGPIQAPPAPAPAKPVDPTRVNPSRLPCEVCGRPTGGCCTINIPTKPQRMMGNIHREEHIEEPTCAHLGCKPVEGGESAWTKNVLAGY